MPKKKHTADMIEAYRREILESSALLRPAEAAEMLGISVSSLKRRVEDGRIAAYRDNPTTSNIRFLASELRDYVKEMRQESGKI